MRSSGLIHFLYREVGKFLDDEIPEFLTQDFHIDTCGLRFYVYPTTHVVRVYTLSGMRFHKEYILSSVSVYRPDDLEESPEWECPDLY